MFRIVPFGISLLLFAALVPMSTTAGPATCEPHTYDAVPVGDFYVWGMITPELWEESNGLSGLQRTNTICEGGSFTPSDTCILPRQTSAISYCLGAYADTF